MSGQRKKIIVEKAKKLQGKILGDVFLLLFLFATKLGTYMLS
jgi:hypothetical protein